MSDEATFVKSGGHLCQGFTRPLHLKDDGLQLFKQLLCAPKLSIRYSPHITFGYLVDIYSLNPVEIGETSAIGAVIFPSYREGAHLEYEKLSPGEATFALAQCLINARNLDKKGFPEMMRLSKSVPCWRLFYSYLDQLQKLMEEQNSLME